MKTKKMKLLSLFFVLASAVAVKTSFNPVCVQAMEDSKSENGYSYGFADIDTFKDVKFFTIEGFNDIMKQSFINYCKNNRELTIHVDENTEFENFDGEYHAFNIYRPTEEKIFKYGLKEDKEDKIISRNNFTFKKFYGEGEPRKFKEIQIAGPDIINFKFKENDQFICNVVNTFGNIVKDGAISLYNWIDRFLPDEVKQSIEFDKWTNDNKEDFDYVNTKLGKYICNKGRWKKVSDGKIYFLEGRLLKSNLIFSIDFAKPKTEIHYFYDITAKRSLTEEDHKLAYLGSVKYNGNLEKKYYYDLNKALNSCLFYCGQIEQPLIIS